MAERLRLLSLFISLLLEFVCIAQEPFQVSEPSITMEGQVIVISYDILNSDASETFEVTLEIKNASGEDINASSFGGDIGSGVAGGNGRRITWDLEKDGIFMDGEVYIDILAKKLTPPTPLVSMEESPGDAEKKLVEDPDPPRGKTNDFNRTGIVLQSLVFPGLGLSRVTGNPHWIRGVAGYGCLAGSILLNRAAIATYGDFQTASTIPEARSLLDKSTQQDNLSEVLVYTAAAIWVSDFIWTLLGTSGLGKSSVANHTSGISIGAGIEPLSEVPLVRISYRF